jgi:hypothetical protein
MAASCMTRLERRGVLYGACMAIAIVLPLLILWRGRLWTFWIWLWS